MKLLEERGAGIVYRDHFVPEFRRAHGAMDVTFPACRSRPAAFEKAARRRDLPSGRRLRRVFELPPSSSSTRATRTRRAARTRPRQVGTSTASERGPKQTATTASRSPSSSLPCRRRRRGLLLVGLVLALDFPEEVTRVAAGRPRPRSRRTLRSTPTASVSFSMRFDARRDLVLRDLALRRTRTALSIISSARRSSGGHPAPDRPRCRAAPRRGGRERDRLRDAASWDSPPGGLQRGDRAIATDPTRASCRRRTRWRARRR